MKKKFLTKCFGIFLAAAVAVTSIPVTTNAQTLSENEVISDKKEIEDIFTFDWKNATDEELDHILGITDFEETGYWLKSLSTEEFNQVIERDTVLNKQMTLSTYDVNAEGDMKSVSSVDSVIYYEYCLTQATGLLKAQKFANKSGYYDYKFKLGDAVSHYRMKISGLDTTQDTSTNQKAKLAIIVVSAPNGNFANFGSNAGNFNANAGEGYTEKNLNRNFDKSGNYYNLTVGFHFTKPAGYTTSLVYENKNSGGNAGIYYYDNGGYKENPRHFVSDTDSSKSVDESLIAHTNLYVNSTVGGTSQTGGAVCYTFTLYPINYSVAYNSNGGSSTPATQACSFGSTYYLGSPGTKVWNVAFNGNGGSTPSTITSACEFAGWKSSIDGKLRGVNTAISNRTTTNGAVETMTAQWNNKAITLPSTTREGYTFGGWYSGNTRVGGIGNLYTPTNNTTLTALWTANNYTVEFDSNGGNDCEAINARYDQEITLPTPTRPGYNFIGWTGASGTHKDKAKNLSSTNGSVVKLTALWEATTVSYTVVHKIQVSGNGDKEEDYEVKETEILKGTAGDSVTPPTKTYEGYKSPDQITQTVDGDGSTVFVYKYRKIIKQSVQYRVEHYLQNKTDKTKYDLDTANSKTYRVVEGSSVTPAVITTYKGYDVPNPQTVTVAKDGSTVVKYYYKLSSSSSNTNITNVLKVGETTKYTDAAGNEYEVFVNQDGTLTILKIKSASVEKLNIAGTITINGVKYQVTEIAPYAFKNNKTIKTLTIGNGITKIGKGAFQGCTKLKSVKFGVGLSVIGARAFYGCTSLEKVKTTKTLTDIGSKAFYNCKKLKSFTIGKYVKKIGSYAFYNCKKLKKITIAESVEIIEKKAFYKCKSLKNVPIKTTKLIKVGSAAFKKCHKSLKFTVPEKKKKAYAKLLKGKS